PRSADEIAVPRAETGASQVFVAVAVGSWGSHLPLLLMSAQAVIVSVPGFVPAYVNMACPEPSVVPLPEPVLTPLTAKRIGRPASGVLLAVSVAVTVWGEPMRFVADGGASVSLKVTQVPFGASRTSIRPAPESPERDVSTTRPSAFGKTGPHPSSASR